MPSPVRPASLRVDLGRALGEAGEREYARLLRVLRAGQGMFAPIPVASDLTAAARDALLARLKKDLARAGQRSRVARLTRERWDPLQALRKAARSGGSNLVLVLVGLEETPGFVGEPGAPRRRPPALALLNQHRESLRAGLPFPLLLWSSPPTFVALQERAPDLFDHFVGLTELLDAAPRPAESWPEREGDEHGVHNLLQREPELAALVHEAIAQLRKFIPDARLELDLLIDPDYKDAQQVFLGVSTSLPETEALRALQRFDHEWWIHHVRRARGLLCIDLRDHELQLE